MTCILKELKQRDWVRGCDCSNPAKVDVVETMTVAVEMEKLER